MIGVVALWAVLPSLSPARFKIETFESTYWFIGMDQASISTLSPGPVSLLAERGNRTSFLSPKFGTQFRGMRVIGRR